MAEMPPVMPPPAEEMMPPPGMPPMLGPDQSDLEIVQTPNDNEKVPIYDSEEARILYQICRDYDLMDDSARSKQVRVWRKHLNYWNSLQYGAWDETSSDWRSPQDILDEDPQADIDPAVYAKVVNVYKAHGEILIGALTSGLPSVRFFPKDADDHDDIAAAKARSKISELIQRHNRARLLFMKAIFLLYNCGFLACYNENKTDYRYGSYKTPDFQDTPVDNHLLTCPMCAYDFGQVQIPQGDEEAAASQIPPEVTCESCGYQGPPDDAIEPGSVPIQVGEKVNPKNREVLEVYGPLNVKVPIWARDQISVPYVCLEDEQPVAFMREIYPEFADKIGPNYYGGTTEESARTPYQYQNDFPRDLCNVQRWWLRPWALNVWDRDLDELKKLKKQFPDGLYVVIINRQFVAEIVADKLDEHWTIAEQPMSETLHAQPIGAPMIPLQDIENELDNLTLEHIEFGIPELFADPRVLDFDAYQRQEIRPGQVSQATPAAGKSLGEAFFEVKATTLSREVDLFADRMNSRQQFVQGTYPSIYGGSQEGSGGTAREYELSKASALQRLTSTWVIVQEWWAATLQRSVDSFVKRMQTDESFVRAKGSNFVNVWIKQADLSGEVSEVEAEVSEPFPVSWAQKRDVIMNLIQMGNEDVMTVIRHPENAGMIATIIGVPELYIPGDDDRNKQLIEISELIVSEPILPPPPGMMGGDTLPNEQGEGQSPMPPETSGNGMGATAGPPPSGGPMGMMPMIKSSVPVEPELDNHAVEAEICKAWLKSEVGMDAKKNNPGGYMNVLQHMKEHLMFASMQMARDQAQEAQAKGGEEEMQDVDKGAEQ